MAAMLPVRPDISPERIGLESERPRAGGESRILASAPGRRVPRAEEEQLAEPAGRDDSSAPRPGAIFAGRYVLGAVLGSGGMGRVYAARDRKLEREVALKVLISPAPEPEVLVRFRREALATSSLQHPNVLAVFDAGEEQGRPFLVTELLRGTTLKEKLAQGPLPAAEALGIARQLLAGLAAAHDKGLTHRDLKPSNIFLTHDGWAKILDFGLVKLAETLLPAAPDSGDPEAAFTASGRTLGTVGYMAPEQVRGKPVDPRADLFNLGLVLYEMVCGKRAFAGASAAETGYAILFKEPAPLPASAPRELRRLIDGCLKKDREQRPAAARVALALLDAPPPRLRGWSGRLPAPGRRGLLAAAVAALLAAAALYGARALRSRPLTPSGAPPSGTVAILPFGAQDAPHFAYLSEGIVDLLSRDLIGSELRAVDPASLLRALGGDSTADLDKVRVAAAQLGAKYFVLGRVEERRGELVLEAVLHTGDKGEPVSQAVALGAPGDLLRLVRKLSDQLQLRPLPPQEFEARLDRLAQRTTRSLQALEAWFEGERLLRRGHWVAGEVMGAFQRAVAADPEFALAHYRLATLVYLSEPGLAEDSLQRALRNSDRLTPAERMLVEGQLAAQQGRFSDAERSFAEATQRYPDDAESWLQLGELYFHQNPLRARSPQEALSAFQHVVVIDPLNTEAISHLVDLALVRGERGLVARLSDRLLSLSDDRATVLGFGLSKAWARDDAEGRARVMSELRGPGVPRALLKIIFVRAEWQMDGFADAEEIARQFAAADAAVGRSYSQLAQGLVELLRGRPEGARSAIGHAAESYPGGDAHADYLLPWIDTLSFVPVTPAQLALARAKVEGIDARDASQVAPAKRYLAGALAARAGDLAAAERAARDLDRMAPLEGSSITTDLALAVRARALAARGEQAAALALLEKQALRVPLRYAPFYGRIAESWLRAELLEALRRPREALPLYDALTFYNFVDAIFQPVAHLRKARLLESLGDRAGAIDHYTRFLELWKDCEPSEKFEVENARSRLAALVAAAPATALPSSAR